MRIYSLPQANMEAQQILTETAVVKNGGLYQLPCCLGQGKPRLYLNLGATRGRLLWLQGLGLKE